MALLDVTRWPLVLLLAAAGLSAVAFAFVTVNLFTEAMANIAFVRETAALPCARARWCRRASWRSGA
jgi:hypothetical protein